MEKARAIDFRPWLVLLAVGLAAAAIWAATALAGGGDGPQGGSKEDCPERGGGTGGAETGGPGV